MTTLDLMAHRGELLRFVQGMVGNAHLAEDLVQETLLRAVAAQQAFAGRSRPLTWLSAIALNALRDHFRRPATRREESAAPEDFAGLADQCEDAVTALMKAEMGDCITAHLSALPDRLREVLVLHDMGGAGHAEVAAALGITEGNARVLLHRARAALRERLGKHCRIDLGGDPVPCSPREDRRP
ncbi:RNA polymerase sigma factor [Paramagnetospirillum magneticum]|uniref:DNA-directed RNA polymerase specialized sigma subunit, sigma24 homolog n=1 Tax=Paramagnetospirillum magneticum (strain ATCC 700264 / AMB-1) TaxID=342108 RepID=Q2W687_PARM1|nr:RNA polymerase sigma factor [Paramagnetospirillum magneticum]BAE50638.1 DNA-directed RNA polymerase specialized sigma subunit, sigma24 homolog [Paramagnetospirillum magneticum AMB-1]